jgi:hypothetical protein
MRHVRFESTDHPTGQPRTDSRARVDTSDPEALLAEAKTLCQLARIGSAMKGPDLIARCDAAISALSIPPTGQPGAAARRDDARRDAWRQPLPSRIQADADAELERRRQGGQR